MRQQTLKRYVDLELADRQCSAMLGSIRLIDPPQWCIQGARATQSLLECLAVLSALQAFDTMMLAHTFSMKRLTADLLSASLCLLC